MAKSVLQTLHEAGLSSDQIRALDKGTNGNAANKAAAARRLARVTAGAASSRQRDAARKKAHAGRPNVLAALTAAGLSSQQIRELGAAKPRIAQMQRSAEEARRGSKARVSGGKKRTESFAEAAARRRRGRKPANPYDAANEAEKRRMRSLGQG